MKIQLIKKEIEPILRRQGVTKAAVFGSVARGEMKKNSDLDLLLEISKKKTFFDLVKLKIDLSEKLGRNVDIVEYDAIHPLMRKDILREQKKII